jgi:hypothetical protein
MLCCERLLVGDRLFQEALCAPEKKRAWGTVRAAEQPQARRFSVEVSQRLLIHAGWPSPAPPAALTVSKCKVNN